jgi:hypothetical protein
MSRIIMHTLTKLTLLYAVVLLTACATPPGKLTDADFVARVIEIPQTVPQSVSLFYESLRYCGPSSGGVVFVTHHGVPDCGPSRPNGTATCDLYVGSGSGRSDLVLGRVDFMPTSRGATVTLRVQTFAGNKEAILAAWEKFVQGKAQEVCPAK